MFAYLDGERLGKGGDEICEQVDHHDTRGEMARSHGRQAGSWLTFTTHARYSDIRLLGIVDLQERLTH